MRTVDLCLLVSLAAGCAAQDSKIVALSPDIVVAPGEVDFGPVVKLYSETVAVQILNTGRGPLDIESIELEVAGGDDTIFAISATDDLPPLGPGDVTEVDVTFTPQNYVDYRARLLVTSDDEDQPVLAVPIDGSGVVGSTPDINLSANSIDFGTVATDETATGYVTIENVGDGELDIAALELEDGPFSLVTDPSEQTLAGGGEFTVIVEYTPTDDEEGHTADLVVQSNDPDEPTVSVVLLGGNGGSYQDPIAHIDCAALAGVTPPRTIVMDGRLSDDPEDISDVHELEFEWSLVRRPELSRTYFMNPEQETPELFIDVAGVYEVQLVVTDFNGIESEPVTCVADITPDEQLYIALSWDTNDSDLDLHLVPEGQAFWGCMDCFFCNPVPGWPAPWGLPIYALDNTFGYGPENINVKDPGGLSYYVRVHYYDDHGGGATNATVSIYVNRTLYGTYTQSFSGDRKRWDVGYVTFDGPCTEDSCEFTFTEEGEVTNRTGTSCPSC